MDEVPRAFSISDIQSSPAGVECICSMHHLYTVIDVNGTLFHIFVIRLASMHTTRINQI